MNTLSLLSNDSKYFDESSTRLNEIRSLLNSKDHSSKLEAMKMLLAMITLGKDVSVFFPDVVKNVIVDHMEIKKLVYMYLQHYSDTNQDLALLSINTFQKDLQSSSQRIRANALRAMSSIQLPVVTPLIVLALRTSVKDHSSYVRRAAAAAITKVYAVDPQQYYDECCELIEQLLTNTEPIVLGSAIFAYNEVCPHNYKLLHPHYRKICHLLADFDEWGQISTVNTMLRYGRTQFNDPNAKDEQHDDAVTTASDSQSSTALVATTNADSAVTQPAPAKPPQAKRKVKPKKAKAFYSDEDSSSSSSNSDSDAGSSSDSSDSSDDGKLRQVVRSQYPLSVQASHNANTNLQQLDEDHRLLLKQSAQLLYSTNTGVVVAVANLYLHLAPRAELNIVVRPLMRAVRSRRAVQWGVLATVRSILQTDETIAAELTPLIAPYLHQLMIFVTDTLVIRQMKLDILLQLTVSASKASNQQYIIQQIWSELEFYVHDVNSTFVCITIVAISTFIGHVSTVEQPESQQYAERALHLLVRLLSHSSQHVVAHAVLAITQLLQISHDMQSTVVKRLARMIERIQLPAARTAIVWMCGEYHTHIPSIAPDVLRTLAKSFRSEDDSVKLQILNLATKLYLSDPSQPQIGSLFKYVMELCKYDVNYDIRDRTRMLRILFFKKKGAAGQQSQSGKLEVDNDRKEEAATISKDASIIDMTSFDPLEAQPTPLATPSNAKQQQQSTDGISNNAESQATTPNNTANTSTQGISLEVKEKLKQFLLTPKPASRVDASIQSSRDEYLLGTMSHMLHERLPGYADLPEWRTEPVDSTLRRPLTTTPSRQLPAAGNAASVAAAASKSRRRRSSTSTSASSDSDSASEAEEAMSVEDRTAYSDADSDAHDSDFSSFGEESASDSDSDAEQPTASRKPRRPTKSHRQNSARLRQDDESDFVSSDEDEAVAAPAKTVSPPPKPAPNAKQSAEKPTSATKSAAASSSKSAAAAKPANKAAPVDILDLSGFNDFLTSTPAMTSMADLLSLPSAPAASTQPTNAPPPASTTAPVAEPEEPPQALYGYTTPSSSVAQPLLDPASSSGLAITYVFNRKPSMYGNRHNWIELRLRNDGENTMQDITFACTSKDVDVKGIDHTVKQLPVGEQFSVHLHCDFHGKLDPVPLQIKAQHGRFSGKLVPLAGDLVQPQLITHRQWTTRRKKLGGMQVHHNKVQLTSVDTAIQRILQTVHTAALAQELDVSSTYRFSSTKLADNTPLLIDLVVTDSDGQQHATVGVYMDDMLGGNEVMTQIVKAFGK